MKTFQPTKLYLWRDHLGREIDLIQEKAGKLLPVEIKSSERLHLSFFETLNWFLKTAGVSCISNLGIRRHKKNDSK